MLLCGIRSAFEFYEKSYSGENTVRTLHPLENSVEKSVGERGVRQVSNHINELEFGTKREKRTDVFFVFGRVERAG